MRSLLSTQLKVGITTILAIGILFGGTFWVKRYNPLMKKDKISILFTDAKGITAGDPVTMSGVQIGKITKVILSEDNKALVEFSNNKDNRFSSDCVFVIKDVGLMGDKMLVIISGNERTDLDVNRIHMGSESTDLGDLITSSREVMNKLNSISYKLDNDLDINKLTSSFEETLTKINQLISVIEEIAQVNREPLAKSINNFESSTFELQHFIQKNDTRLKSAIDSFNKTSEKISSALDKIGKLSTVVDTLSVYMVSGDGTLAKLIKSNELYEELRQTNASIDSFITDFKINPGKYTKDMKFKIRLF